jgi:hypothetical protein
MGMKYWERRMEESLLLDLSALLRLCGVLASGAGCLAFATEITPFSPTLLIGDSA